MVSEHCVACRIVTLGLDKPLRKIGVVFVPKLIYKQSCKLFPQPFGLILHLFYFKLDGQSLPHGQRLHHVLRTSSTLMTSTSSTLMTSTSSTFSTRTSTLDITKDYN